MPLESERPFWLRELPSGSVTPEDNLSRAIEDSEEEGQRVLERMQFRSSRFGAFYSLNNDSRGLSAVHLAVLCKRYRTLRLLLSSGLVDINEPSTNPSKKGWTALHFAAFTMDLEAIHILLSHSCDTSVRTELGSTPLHFVNGRFGGRDVHPQSHVLNIMKTLIVAGVDPKATNHYGFSVLHESIMWSDVTSLCVMLEQSTAHYFERLLLIGSHVLPHELAWRSPTLPPVFKNMLENAYFVQKQLKESTGVTPKVKAEFLRVCEKLEFICNPSPPTVERVRFPHPESLTARDVGSLLRSAPQGLVVEALKFDSSILEYRPYSLTEARYVFPAYFPHSLAEWVCTDCRECRVVAGRWFNTETEKAGRNVVVQLMTLLLSESSFRESTAVTGAAYFSTLSGVQLGIRCVDRVRSQGVLIHVCSSTSSTTECRKLLDYVVDSAYQLHGGMGPVSVVSSRDLRTGKSIPHLFSRSEISRALASHMTFLPNPASMHTADTIADLLLTNSQPPTERVERDGLPAANPIPIPKPQRTLYHHSVVWSQDVYQRAVENHRDDIATLVDPEVVTDCLVSEGVFSPSDQNYITSAEGDEKISRFLEKVEEKRAYQVSFSILQETGEQLPAHGRLWDILNETCNEIDCSGSLNNYYMDECGLSSPHSFAPRSTHSPSPTPPAVLLEPRSSCTGRTTRESGYGTCGTEISVESRNQSRYECTSPSSSTGRFCTACPQRSSCPFCTSSGSSVTGVRGIRRERPLCSVSIATCFPEECLLSSLPITIPRRDSQCSSHSHESTSPQQQPQQSSESATKGSSTPKHLSSATPTSLWQRLVDALFSAPTPTDEENSSFGLKLF